MYLKRLEMQGFKSFADKTVLEFMPGITSVIGPNGSGKSNIADAIRWILGEQSMKSLRGAKTQDIIFAGTQNRKSLGFAEASLVFDNTDGTYQVGTSEISIQLLNTLKNNLYFRAIDNAGNISDTKEIKAQNSEVKNNEIKNNNGNDNKTDDEQINSNNKDTKYEIDNTKATKILPKAGEKRRIILILASLIIVMIFSIKKYKNLKEIK